MSRSKLCSLPAAFVAGGICLGMIAIPAAAQVEPEGEEEVAARTGIDTITVTAQRREQSILDVPLAVSAFGTDELTKSGVDDIQEVMGISPSFQASTNSSESQGLVIRLRGIGTQGNNPAFESAVGVFIDGIYRSRAGAALSELLDVERLEVLRGPQGTLFGRNTTAGALNIVTAGPEFEFGGYAEATYGNYNNLDIRSSITGPLFGGNTAAVRFSALYTRRDGLVDDTFTDASYDDRNRYTLKGQLLFQPAENVDVRVIADLREQNESCCYPVTLRNGVAASIFNSLGALAGFPDNVQIVPADPFGREASKTVGEPLTQDVSDRGISAEVNIQFGNANFTSLTAFRDFESFRQLDIDFTALDVLNQDLRNDGIEAFTQEMRLQGEAGWLDWLVGAYFIDETVTLSGKITHGEDYEEFINARLGGLITALTGGAATNYSTLAGLVNPACNVVGTCWADGTGTGIDHFQSDNQAWSLFTHNVISFTDNLKLTLGARYNVDRKHAFSELSDANTPGCDAIKQTPLVNSTAAWASFDLAGIIPGDTRRIVDVVLALGCLGITSDAFEYDVNKDDNEWSGTAILSYQFNDGPLAFGSYSRGFKAGGANLDRAGTILTATGVADDLPGTPVDESTANFLDPRFNAELVDNFEVGLKGTLWDNRVQYSSAVFYMLIDDFQLNTFTGFNFVPENVDAATSLGVEFEFQAQPIEGLNIRGGVTWAQTDYDDGVTDLTNILTNDRGFRIPIDLLPEISSLAGRQLTNAPRWVETFAVTYTTPLANSNIQAWAHFDARFDSGYNTGSDLDPVKEQDGYTVVNAQLGLGQIDGGWEIALWAKNLLDRNYHQVAFDIPLQSNDGWGSFLADPRTFGGTLRVRF